MAGGGPRPGAGRPKGSRNKTTIQREIVEAQVRAQRVAAGVAIPVLAKEKLELLLSMAWRHMEEALAAGKAEDYVGWFERAGAMAKALAPYQSPQLKALAVAHADMRPSPIDLSRLSDKQLEQLRKLIILAGPSNVAGARRVDDGGAADRDRPRRLIDRRPRRLGDDDTTH
jgi:hypothetical protein